MRLHHRSLVGVYDVAGKRNTWVCAHATPASQDLFSMTYYLS